MLDKKQIEIQEQLDTYESLKKGEIQTLKLQYEIKIQELEFKFESEKDQF